MPTPLQPTKAAAIWCFEYAAAVRFEETFLEFVAAYPDTPLIGGAE